ncbi:uncharacterized protein K460DRAFT_352887 [Cucurbitaria berberidis CBS 394.84]|uniref:Uncharacterized protein n=1 Tax=Cucurbitaria berberidis CBS 394.84 TaxID=1168544 RepID=A0A9P4GMK5_9PLEO|nr:uncharacterized protein K460DRAFT_352887 [Cucurbitaria berberidis CBS 394.84]KAF1847811.1 hypothetical protein K460DRAFT_352887 [Cucurbitaria berberidis CBS 394.84]
MSTPTPDLDSLALRIHALKQLISAHKKLIGHFIIPYVTLAVKIATEAVKTFDDESNPPTKPGLEANARVMSHRDPGLLLLDRFNAQAAELDEFQSNRLENTPAFENLAVALQYVEMQEHELLQKCREYGAEMLHLLGEVDHVQAKSLSTRSPFRLYSEPKLDGVMRIANVINLFSTKEVDVLGGESF